MTHAQVTGPDLTQAASHFAFGDNWASFVNTVDQPALNAARQCLSRLLTPNELRGASLLDIGCGSGLSMLAASELGAACVEGVDIDPRSVDAARALFAKAGKTNVARVASVFDLDPMVGLYDIVHSWGVLHHTGDMWRAIASASALTRPGGLFAVALYRKTALCSVWRVEKRFYSHAPRWQQAAVAGVYKVMLLARVLASGRSPSQHLRDYHSARGMSWRHDVHDWLGGYPYESVSPAELANFLTARGFVLRRQIVESRQVGLFGSGCDQFVWERRLA